MSTLRNAVSRRRGMVLIIVLSVLAVMAILGISLLTLNALDKTVTDNHLHQVQARLSARSGIEDAISRLQNGMALRSAFDTENEWVFKGDTLDGADAAKRDVPLANAQFPSFPKKAANGQPESVDLWRDDLKSNMRVGVSGTLPGKYHGRSNVYSLEVRDLASCIYLNDGVHLYNGNQSSVSQNLARILNRLGEQSKVGIAQLGSLVMRLRPSTGFASWQDFCQIMKSRGGINDAQLARMQRYLTTIAWVDKNVVNPVPLSSAVIGHYGGIKYERGDGDSYIYRRGPGRDHKNEDRSKEEKLAWLPDFAGITGQGGLTTKVYGQDELFPTYVEVTHRAPVNINTAEEPVLIALLADLKGIFILEKRSGAPFGADTPSTFVYNCQWPDALPATGAVGMQDPKPMSLSQQRGWFTFENMGHTYSRQPWKAKVEVNETADYRSLYGATSPSTNASMQYELVEDHDALGELWVTQTFFGGDSSSTVAGGVSARSVAQEIMACRSRTGRYANAAFGGPFKSWAQFYAFCDNLVSVRKDGTPGAGVLRDDRFQKPDQRSQAEQAMADMLKANFNPNFTPNEINPDHNLYLMVDKTDLVVNSTEFCFLPTGLFSISAVGRVIRDKQKEGEIRKSGMDTGLGPQEVVAQSRIDAVIRAYDMYRETSQRHFYLGDATPAEDCTYTNNALTVESGPESDNGPLLYNEHLGHEVKFQRLTPDVDGYLGDSTFEKEVMSGWGYEGSGYMQLPTRGGFTSVKPRGQIYKIENCGEALTKWDQISGLTKVPTMRASFRLNDQLDYSIPAVPQVDYLKNAASQVLLGGNVGTTVATISEYVYNPATCSGQVITRVAGGSTSKPRIEQASNFPDNGEEGTEGDGGVRLSPYDPADATRYRLVRSYRLPLSWVPGTAIGKQTVAAPLTGPGTETLPRMLRAAPSDLRTDGMYVERHSGLAYWIEEAATGDSFSTYQGTASFWFKPGFDPAYSGKVRSIASASKYHRKNFYYRNPSPFTLFYMPSFGNGDGNTTATNGGVGSAGTYGMRKIPVWNLPDYKRLTQIPSASMVFQISYSTFDGSGWGFEYEWTPPPGQGPRNSPLTPGKYNESENFWVTDNLNKRSIGEPETDASGLRAHRWTHITMSWMLADNAANRLSTGRDRVKVLINGQEFNRTPGAIAAAYAHNQCGFQNAGGQVEASRDRRTRIADQDFIDHVVGPDGGLTDERWHFSGDRWQESTDRFIVNTFRLGEVSTHSFMPDTFTRNFSSDGTYDEFYFWKDTNPDDMGGTGLASFAQPNNVAGKKFMQGRYYVPTSTSEEDAMWTSPELTLKTPALARELASPGKGTASGHGRSGTTVAGNMTTTAAVRPTARLLGVSWTWYAEKYNSEVLGNTLGGMPSLTPVMVDYQNPAGPVELRQEKACVRLFLKVDELRYPLNDPMGFTNDAFSSIQDSHGQPVALGEAGKFRYQVKFRIEGADSTTVLLSTPVLDDVTFYYLTPGSMYLQYVERSEIE